MFSRQLQRLVLRPARPARRQASVAAPFTSPPAITPATEPLPRLRARQFTTSTPTPTPSLQADGAQPPGASTRPAAAASSPSPESLVADMLPSRGGATQSPSLNDTSLLGSAIRYGTSLGTSTPASSTSASASSRNPASAARQGVLSSVADILKMEEASPLSALSGGAGTRRARPHTADIARGVISTLRQTPDRDLRLTPSLGRTIDINNKAGMDAVRAIRMLEIKCAQNKVRAHQREQKFHVRRSQRKKDLRMRRWRALFKKSFKQTLSRCAKMKAQGW
ncbi:hypothetical protein KEM52_003991 [Ascosphaera acerosa]|nr:hypothetical protein KEM52_003991 [Ascosphaera acerosa]